MTEKNTMPEKGTFQCYGCCELLDRSEIKVNGCGEPICPKCREPLQKISKLPRDRFLAKRNSVAI
ncbi:hypothetical protein A2V71_04575 [Candidatus Berkelbacteria bacterium RBG_13_40_8]|uniref:Uncharacterized protein n=1 Tax=Candidatus Berkelbacteria bacterium RBG_13_40_8 TaxID=1797467 RepID=A0A1F5DMJ1_9BACT|nr:MAG: hypothetical protein A2V71_04575 [Candidatus Berkelbacteria bacterium RBG_13_40_8]